MTETSFRKGRQSINFDAEYIDRRLVQEPPALVVLRMLQLWVSSKDETSLAPEFTYLLIVSLCSCGCGGDVAPNGQQESWKVGSTVEAQPSREGG